MDIREIFKLYNQQNTSESISDLPKLHEEVTEYVDRMKFAFTSSGIFMLCGTYFLYVIVKQTGDLRFALGFFVLVLLFFFWIVGIIQFLEKKKRLQQIITYSSYRYITAKCTYVTQMNMMGIRYEFIMSESPSERFQIDALKMENYVMDVRAGDEVCIVQYFSIYYVVFSIYKQNKTIACNDFQSVLSMENYNKKQRDIYLKGSIVGILLMMYIIYVIFEKEVKEFPIAMLAFVIDFFVMHLAIFACRTKK